MKRINRLKLSGQHTRKYHEEIVRDNLLTSRIPFLKDGKSQNNDIYINNLSYD